MLILCTKTITNYLKGSQNPTKFNKNCHWQNMLNEPLSCFNLEFNQELFTIQLRPLLSMLIFHFHVACGSINGTKIKCGPYWRDDSPVKPLS